MMQDGRVLASGRSGSRASSDVSILIGNGDGTFRPQVRIPITGGPRAAAVGDLNGDGFVGLATANVLGDTVGVLLGNGDGKGDVATANYSSDDASVLLGNGDGTLAAQVRYPVGDAGESILAVDVNGGGTLDLAVLDGISGELSILLGNGNGT